MINNLIVVEFNTDGFKIDDAIGRISLNKGDTLYQYTVRPQSLINDCGGGCTIILDDGDSEQILIEGICKLNERGFLESSINCYFTPEEPDWLRVEIWLD